MSTNFSDLLKQRREEKGLTRQQLATAASVTPAAIRLYEIGQREPTLSVLRALAAALDCSIDYLAGITAKQKPQDEQKADELQKARDFFRKYGFIANDSYADDRTIIFRDLDGNNRNQTFVNEEEFIAWYHFTRQKIEKQTWLDVRDIIARTALTAGFAIFRADFSMNLPQDLTNVQGWEELEQCFNGHEHQRIIK